MSARPQHHAGADPTYATPVTRPGRASLTTRLVFLMLGCLAQVQGAGPAPLRFGFARAAFPQINESDIRAALKVWSQTLGTERGIPVDPVMELFADTDELKSALLEGKVDAATILTEQYWRLRREIRFGSIILGRSQGRFTEEYLLLVPRDAPVTQLSELRGRQLNILEGARGGLGEIWLETLLLEANQGRSGDFWGRVTRTEKTGGVVLPVFFRKADACVVTRNGFNTMNELNPQVGRQLKILAASPPMVPTVFCFRGDLVSPYRDKLVAEISEISKTVAGRQTLALFQSDQLMARPVSDLDEACALLDRHAQLLAGLGSTQSAAAGGER